MRATGRDAATLIDVRGAPITRLAERGLRATERRYEGFSAA